MMMVNNHKRIISESYAKQYAKTVKTSLIIIMYVYYYYLFDLFYLARCKRGGQRGKGGAWPCSWARPPGRGGPSPLLSRLYSTGRCLSSPKMLTRCRWYPFPWIWIFFLVCGGSKKLSIFHNKSIPGGALIMQTTDKVSGKKSKLKSFSLFDEDDFKCLKRSKGDTPSRSIISTTSSIW